MQKTIYKFKVYEKMIDDILLFLSVPREERENEVRVSSLAGCPGIWYCRKYLNEEFQPSVLIRLKSGEKAHSYRKIFYVPGKILSKEERYDMSYKNIIISGQPDLIYSDYKIHLLDYKTTQLNAFYYKLREGIPDLNFKQINYYKLLYFLNTGIEIDSGIIQFIDEENISQFLQIEKELLDLETIYKMLIDEYIIKYLISLKIDVIIEGCRNFKDKYPFFCKNCNFSCPILNKTHDKKEPLI